MIIFRVPRYDARMPPRIPIATAALVRHGLILLAHRHPKRRWYPDCWDLVGGHIEAGESAEQAVIRECREELAIHIRDPRPVPMAFSDPTIELHAFVVEHWDGDPANAAPDEHDQLRWFSPDELASLNVADAASLPDIVRLIRPTQVVDDDPHSSMSG